MYVCAVALEISNTRVGALLGRHRTSVTHARRMVEDRRDDEAFDAWLTAIESRVPRLAIAA